MSEEKAPDVAGIAGRLSDEAREKLCAVSVDGWPETSITTNALDELYSSGLIWKMTLPRLPYSKHFGPSVKGLALRRHLMEKNDVQG